MISSKERKGFMSTDTYCIWNEYSNDFDIVDTSYCVDVSPSPLQTLVWNGLVKETDFMYDNEYEEYPEGPYVEKDHTVNTSYVYVPPPLNTSFALRKEPDYSTWTLLTPVIEETKSDTSEEIKTHLWTASKKWEDGYDMRNDPAIIAKFKDEVKSQMTWDSMDKALYSVYISNGETRSMSMLLTKYKSMSYTATEYIRWYIETQKLPTMKDMEKATGKSIPGWETMKKADLIKAIKKTLYSDMSSDFKWENIWCDIHTSVGPGFVNYGYIINSIPKKTQPGRLLGRTTSSQPQTSFNTAPTQQTSYSQNRNQRHNNNNSNSNNNKGKYTRKDR